LDYDVHPVSDLFALYFCVTCQFNNCNHMWVR
jgi:hypothetical protein